MNNEIDATFDYNKNHEDDKVCLFRELGIAFKEGARWALSNQWISVKDKLPSKDNDYVLCHLVNSDEIVSGYIGKNNQVETNPIFEFDAMGDYTCDYWMPIPKFKEE